MEAKGHCAQQAHPSAHGVGGLSHLSHCSQVLLPISPDRIAGWIAAGSGPIGIDHLQVYLLIQRHHEIRD